MASFCDQDKYIKAWNFSCCAHNGQLLPGSELPYINHIGNVAMEALAVIANGNEVNNPDLLVQCALLHDILEDTSTDYQQLELIFGKEVADGVLALTKNNSLSTKSEQMADSLDRIAQQPREIWMVKLVDRITNLQPPPGHWTQEKIIAYRNEALLILDKLGSASNYLASRLQLKISQYANNVPVDMNKN